MDPAPLELAVAQAKTGLAQAQAQLDAVNQQAPSSADLSAARANVTAAEAAYSAAKVALTEVGKKGPTRGQLDAAHAATVAAKKSYDAANAAYLALKASIDASAAPTPANLLQLGQLEATKDQAYAGYLSAKATEDSLKATSLTAAKKQAQAAVDQALAALKGAQAQLAKLQSTSTSASRAAAQAAVNQAEEAVRLATANVEKGTFFAPFTGVVLFNPIGTPGADGEIPKASAGAGVAPSMAPFTVVDLAGVRFSADVDEADISRVQPGMAVTVRLDAFSGETFKSKVLEVRSAAQLTATGGTVFPVDISLNDTGRPVLIGMQGDASISVSSVPNAVVIPVEALFDQNGVSYVYVVENGHLKQTTITTGAITDTNVQVLTGLKPGQVVALSGSVQYTNGMAVRTR